VIELRAWDERDLPLLGEAAGFAREGLLRGYARYGDEPRRDVYLYGLLR
jgi:RimJ/RimL family protein N-acetyltransferase